jgi:hypothetical protein
MDMRAFLDTNSDLKNEGSEQEQPVTTDCRGRFKEQLVVLLLGCMIYKRFESQEELSCTGSRP